MIGQLLRRLWEPDAPRDAHGGYLVEVEGPRQTSRFVFGPDDLVTAIETEKRWVRAMESGSPMVKEVRLSHIPEVEPMSVKRRHSNLSVGFWRPTIRRAEGVRAYADCMSREAFESAEDRKALANTLYGKGC